MTGRRGHSGAPGALALLGAALVMVLCCAGPLLLAGGALGAVGGELRNPWLITVGAGTALISVAYVLRRHAGRRRGVGPGDCCPSVPITSSAADGSERRGADPRAAPLREGVPAEQPTPHRRSEEYR